MKTIVTIDLDYWTNCYTKFQKSAVTLINECISLSNKSYVIDHHHKILEFIPNDTEKIVNIDFHNDILGESSWSAYNLDKIDDINEGTWGNFLPNSVSSFQWYYPSHKKCIIEGYGLCTDHNELVHDDYPVDQYNQYCKIKNLKLESITNFILCISPEWAYYHDYLDYLEYLNIPNDKYSIKSPIKIKG